MIQVLLPAWAVGVITWMVMLPILVFWGGSVCVLGLIRAVIPLRPVQDLLAGLGAAAASQWVASNQLVYRVLLAPAWQTEIREKLDPKKSYLVICNHQAWADILILFDLMHGRIPFLRFFLKHELIWVPIIGVGCWALDMPFMKRHSREAIKANPALRGEDLATTRRFCEKFKARPIAVVNFPEGTRFSEEKRVSKGSPYRHLLRPKAAGLSFVLNAMGDQFGGIIDVTIAYQPTEKALTWSWMCGEQNQMKVHIDTLPIPPEMIAGDYEGDEAFRARFQDWVNGLWSRKDARLERMQTEGQPQARPRLT